MDSDLQITLCGPAEAALWDEYVERCPTTTVCHHFLWQHVIKAAYGHEPVYLLAREGNTVRGICPLFIVRSRLFGKSLTSMPFLDYGGVCADNDTIAQHLIDEALRQMTVHGLDFVEIRQYGPLPNLGTSRSDKFGMVLDLSPGTEAVWKSLPAKVRNQVRKAEKSGLTVTIGGGELLDDFYPVFAVNMRDLGSPVHDKDFFAQIFTAFGPQVRLIMVWDGKRSVGGLICFSFKETVTVPWASCLREYFPKCPNNILYWEALRYTCNMGGRKFDFGRSSLDSGTYNFKQQWGALPIPISWQLIGHKAQPNLAFSAGTNSKLLLALEAWKRLPVAVATLIGPRIRKYLTN
ncbi:MAG: FemAB family PEP-CTERM system-associated protein [Deltaproteobacteria bacterium]|nr:FemAB family PEP-CTERM system-associated protein [Deltaproteobacteria bacterium]